MASWRGCTARAATSWPPCESTTASAPATSSSATSPAPRRRRWSASSSQISTPAAAATPPSPDPLPPHPVSPRTADSKKPELATLALHAGTTSRDTDTPVVNPLVQSVNFNQEIGTGDGLRYPRYGNSPNAQIVQQRVAALEGAEAAVLLSSGMGAVACALLALLRPGDHLLASANIYGGVTRLL